MASGLPTAVTRVTGVSDPLASAGPLPIAGQALATRCASSASVAVMDRMVTTAEAALFDDPVVMPPRTFIGWTDDADAVESTPTPISMPLPMATLARRGRGAVARTAPRRHTDAAGAHGRTAPASTSAPHLLARSLAPAPRSSTATAAAVAAAHAASLNGGSVGEDPAFAGMTHARVHLGRRVISRSIDGRHVRWTAPATEPSVDLLAANEVATVAAFARDAPSGALHEAHVLRRTLYAANEISATLGDQSVAPPSAGRFTTDPTDERAPTPVVAPDPGRTTAIQREVRATPSAPSDRPPVVPTVARRGADARVAQSMPSVSMPAESMPSRSKLSAVTQWVPALPGTLFSTPANGGTPVRRALITLPEMLRAASTAADAPVDAPLVASSAPLTVQRTTARPGHAAIVHGAVVGGRDEAAGKRFAEAPAAPMRASAQQATVTRHEPEPAARSRIAQASTTAAPFVDADALAVAPRSAQRVADGDLAEPGIRAAAPPGVAAARAGAAAPDALTTPAALADRFLTELARHRQERPKPLPTQFASIANLIVGKKRPLVSTSEASQRALAAVDKVAATTGDVIHLAVPSALSRPTAEMTGIIAHELTHVAAPSPAPRFFADDRHTAEERRATEIGEIMRRSSAPPPSGSIASRGRTTPMTITEQHTRSASTGSVTSTSTTSNGIGGQADTIRRAMDSAAAPAPSVQRALTETAPSMTSSSNDSSDFSGSNNSINSAQFSRLLREHFDLIVELLEDRIGSDIERRGGRYRGGY